MINYAAPSAAEGWWSIAGIVSRRVAVAMFACAALVVGLAPLAPAAAANPLQWAQESVVRSTAASRLVGDQFDPILCTASATTDYSTVRFSTGGCGAGSTQLVLRSPSGRFSTGEVITYSGAPGGMSWVHAPVQPLDLQSPCFLSTITETVTVLAATHDGTGQLSSLALDYDVECGAWSGRAIGSVRWNDSTPYGVGGVSASYVAPPAMPVDLTEQVVLPITVIGSSTRHVTGVALGSDSRLTTLASDTCTGADLSAGSTCTVTVSVDSSSSPASSKAVAFVDLAVSSGSTIRVARSFSLRPAMVAPRVLPVPTSSGALVVVQGDAAATDTASVLRRVHGTSSWTALDSALAQPAWPDLLAYSDTTALPGTTYDYAAHFTSAGSPSFDGPVGTGTVVLPAGSLTVTTRTRIAGQDHGAVVGAPSPIFSAADTNLAQTAQVSRTGTRTTVTVLDASPQSVAGFAVGLLPGPGIYTGVDLPDGWQAVLASTSCPSEPTDSLWVRSVLYDDTGALVALDASARMSCSPLTRDLEIRFHTGDALALAWPSPDRSSLVADPSDSSITSVVTVTNPGPDAVGLGTRVVSGSGAASFTVGACSAITLAAGTSCTFSVVYHGAATPTTDAVVVAIPATAGSTSQPPITVSLSGRTTDLPGAPVSVAATVEPGRTVVVWSAPVDDGGRAVTSYVVQRSTTADPDWQGVSTQSATAGLNRFSDAASPLEGAAYRVSAVTSRGTGPASADVGPSFDAAPAVMVGMWAERGSSAAWGLYLGSYGSSTPAALEVDGYEHENPTATPDGRSVVYSRAATAGAGQDDYDLYRLAFTPGAAAVQLTDTPGAEFDAETSPDNARISYTHYAIAPGGSFTTPEICLMPASGALGQLPGPCLGGYSHASWLSPTLVVASDDRTATGTIVRIPVSSDGFGTPTPLLPPTGLPGDTMAGASDPTVSPDGTRVAFVDAQGLPSIYVTACDCVFGGMYAGVGSALWFLPTWATPDQPVWAGAGISGPVGATLPNGSHLAASEVSGVPLPDTAPPVVGGLSASYVRPGTAVHVTVTDAGSPRGGVALACAVDGGAATACTGGLVTTALMVGHHQVHIVATDPSGNVAEADRALTVDATPPTTAALSLPAYTLTASTTAAFSAADSLSPIAYDLRYRTWLPSTVSPGGWSATLTGLTSTRRTLSVASSGRTCVQVRARDAAGNVGAWSVERCTTRPTDDRALRALDSGWVRTTGSAYLGGTATQTVRSGVRLVSVTGLSTRQVAVVATACPTCGAVSVWVAGVRVGTVDLRTSTTVARRVFVVALGPARYGQLELRTLSRRLVRIDAVILLR